MPRLYLTRSCLCSRLRLLCVVVGLSIMAVAFVRNLGAQDMPEHKLMSDPGAPTTQYVLNKLNAHLITNARNMDNIEELQRRISALDSTKEQVLRLQDRFDTMLSIVKAVFGGVVTLLLKELAALIHVRLPKKPGEDDDPTPTRS